MPKPHSAALEDLHRLYWSVGLPIRKIERQLHMGETLGRPLRLA